MTASARNPDAAPSPCSDGELAQVARRITRLRRRRDALFEPLSFADPQWDILLDLFAEDGAGRQVSMSSLCIAAAVPTTTAVRCINVMVEQGMLVRSRDVDDARRVLVSMSERTREAMRAWLRQVAETLGGE